METAEEWGPLASTAATKRHSEVTNFSMGVRCRRVSVHVPPKLQQAA